jgi:hypothetical protein
MMAVSTRPAWISISNIISVCVILLVILLLILGRMPALEAGLFIALGVAQLT